ncbi:MAG: hypothetical protein M1828_003001 [Chrysothrix sp. TS-e1954]|nr:MAG: hypothetical protein M1828_003001 [Chrysothrix sp. TS-e1954]
MASLPELEHIIQEHSAHALKAQSLECCCGNLDCAFLRHGVEAIHALEGDVKAAATVGQALLVRHETHLANAGQERIRTAEKIADMERVNAELEADNARVLAGNKDLVTQVEQLNRAITKSDTHINTLTTTLNSTQREMQRLTSLATRTVDLERQILEYEAHQAHSQVTLQRSEEKERDALDRWRTSERQLRDLQYQLESIEADAAEERQRNLEVVERMRRRDAAEKELGCLSTSHRARPEKNEVVSSFVKEILLDNANLQLNVVDLQDRLQSSLNELDRLRDVPTDDQTLQRHPRYSRTPLESELDPGPGRQISQELHIHHHYHAPPVSSQNRVRSKKKRPAIMPVRAIQTKDTGKLQESLETQALESWDASVSPEHQRNRWSAHSTTTKASNMSSGMSSPRSTVFDRLYEDDTTDFSRPTSPESDGITSPVRMITCADPVSDEPPSQPLSVSSDFPANSPPGREITPVRQSRRSSAEHGPHPFSKSPDNSNKTELSQIFEEEDENHKPILERPSRLRRTASQTSLLSISGMDIHSTFPSADRPGRPTALRSKASFTQQNTSPILSSTVAQAARGSSGGAHTALHRTLKGKANAVPNWRPSSSEYAPLVDTFGHRLGGWLSSRISGNAPLTADNNQEASKPNIHQKANASRTKMTVRPPINERLMEVTPPRDIAIAASNDPTTLGPSTGSCSTRGVGSAEATTMIDREALEDSLSEHP